MVYFFDWTFVVVIIAIAIPIFGLLVHLFIRTIDQSAKREYETLISSNTYPTTSEDSEDY